MLLHFKRDSFSRGKFGVLMFVALSKRLCDLDFCMECDWEFGRGDWMSGRRDLPRAGVFRFIDDGRRELRFK